MKTTKNSRKQPVIHYLHSMGIVTLVSCMLIGAYGIIKAPASDQKELEQELTKNEQLLQREEATKTFSPTTAPLTKVSKKQGAKKKNVPKKTITVIGDSVFLGASPAFKKLYKNAIIDAKVSRQVCQALDIAKALNKQGKLGNTVIIALGTNGNFNSKVGQSLIRYLGKKRTVYWVLAYGKHLDIQKAVNQTIQRVAKANKNVHLIPWDEEAPKHSNWFYQDGIHLNATGQKGYAKFIKKCLS